MQNTFEQSATTKPEKWQHQKKERKNQLQARKRWKNSDTICRKNKEINKKNRFLLMKYCSLCSIAAKVKADILWQPGHHRALLQTDLSAICGEVSALFWARKFCEQELKLQSIKVLSGEEFDDFILQLSQLKRNSFGIIFFFLWYCDQAIMAPKYSYKCSTSILFVIALHFWNQFSKNKSISPKSFSLWHKHVPHIYEILHSQFTEC